MKIKNRTTCPYCEKSNPDYTSLEQGNFTDEKVRCLSCYESYLVSRDVVVTYKTSEIKG